MRYRVQVFWVHKYNGRCRIYRPRDRRTMHSHQHRPTGFASHYRHALGQRQGQAHRNNGVAQDGEAAQRGGQVRRPPQDFGLTEPDSKYAVIYSITLLASAFLFDLLALLTLVSSKINKLRLRTSPYREALILSGIQYLFNISFSTVKVSFSNPSNWGTMFDATASVRICF